MRKEARHHLCTKNIMKGIICPGPILQVTLSEICVQSNQISDTILPILELVYAFDWFG